jgi:hypothetical protein
VPLYSQLGVTCRELRECGRVSSTHPLAFRSPLHSLSVLYARTSFRRDGGAATATAATTATSAIVTVTVTAIYIRNYCQHSASSAGAGGVRLV